MVKFNIKFNALSKLPVPTDERRVARTLEQRLKRSKQFETYLY